jgi:hypothetical protein
LRNIRLCAALTLVLAWPCLASDDTHTYAQVGTFTCGQVPPSNPLPGALYPIVWQCPMITFPQPFGGQPSVILSIYKVPELKSNSFGGYISLTPTNITQRGFSPLAASPNFALVAGSDVGVNWLATGPSVFHGDVVLN